jgi:Rrf2 family transcriptional regulator, cysteine metabolism repressor
MKLTTKSEYSLLILIHLARAGRDRFVRLDDICESASISVKYAEQLVAILKKNNWVESRRGAAGGYRLAQEPDHISMASIVRAMDGALAPTGAVSEYFHAHTVLEREPGVIAVMQNIRDYVATVMESKTLEDLI